jgi:hypothetical protein
MLFLLLVPTRTASRVLMTSVRRLNTVRKFDARRRHAAAAAIEDFGTSRDWQLRDMIITFSGTA